jgi:hypothetical protein
MPRRPALFRILIATLLLLALTVPLAQAAGPDSPRTRSTAGSFSLADLLGRAWGSLVGFWLDNGCIADPNGRCTTSPAKPATDNGCGADPNGRCATAPATRHPAPTADNGCSADPDGRCRVGS